VVEAPHGVVRGAGPTRSNTGETRPGRARPAPRTVVRGPAPHGLRGGGPSRSHTGRTFAVVQGPRPGAVVSGRKPPGTHTPRTPHGGAQSEPRTVVRSSNPARSCTARAPRGSHRGRPEQVVHRGLPSRSYAAPTPHVVHGGGPPRSYAGRARAGHAWGRAPAVVRGALAGAGSRSCARRPGRSCPALPRPHRSSSVRVRGGSCVVRTRCGRFRSGAAQVVDRPDPPGPPSHGRTRPGPRAVVRRRVPRVVREAAGTRARRGPRQACPGTSLERPGIAPTYSDVPPEAHPGRPPGADPGRTPGEAPDAPRGPATPRAHVTWC
jgi:hypothetical protein